MVFNQQGVALVSTELKVNLMMHEEIREKVLGMLRDQIRPSVKMLMRDPGVLEDTSKAIFNWFADKPDHTHSRMSKLLEVFKSDIYKEIRGEISMFVEARVRVVLNELFEQRFEQVTAFRQMAKEVVRELVKEELARLLSNATKQ